MNFAGRVELANPADGAGDEEDEFRSISAEPGSSPPLGRACAESTTSAGAADLIVAAHGRIARDVEAAVGAGEDLTAQPAALLRVSAAAKNITIRLPLEDLEKARALARRRGRRYQSYVRMLLHQALAADQRQLP